MALSEPEFYAQAKTYCTEKGYKPGWLWHTFKHTFGRAPDPAYEDIPAAPPTPAFFAMIAPGGSQCRPAADPAPLRPDGWLTAQEIIDMWNNATGAQEHPTMIGQMLVKAGVHRDPAMRLEKIPGRPALYSPAAQEIIFAGLDDRERGRR